MLPPGVNSWTDPSNNEAWLAGQIAFTSKAGTLYAKAVFDKNPIAASTKLLPPPLGPAKQRFLAPAGTTSTSSTAARTTRRRGSWPSTC